MWTVIQGDARQIPLGDETVQCVVTSPPYWGLRDYGIGDDAIGLESTPELYIEHMVQVFQEVRRVLRKDGTVWMNLGDSYATGGGAVGRAPGGGDQGERFIRQGMINTQPNRMPIPGLKPKDLCGIPWRVALALQQDGWWLRSEITLCKDNPMPESTRDRPTSATEKMFLLTKSSKYFYDDIAVRSVPPRATDGAAFGGSTLTPEVDSTLSTDNRSPNLRGRCYFSESQVTVDGAMTWDAKDPQVVRSVSFTIIGEQSEWSFVVDLQSGIDLAAFTKIIRTFQGFTSCSSPIRATIINPTTTPCWAIDTNSMSAVPFAETSPATISMFQARQLLTKPIMENHPTIVAFYGEPLRMPLYVFGTFRSAHVDHDNRNTQSSQGRNLRNWWRVVSEPFPGAHFATFGTKWIEPCIKAGTSEKGCCAECGSPWERVVEKGGYDLSGSYGSKQPGQNSRMFRDRDPQHDSERKRQKKPNGWQQGPGRHDGVPEGDYGGKWAGADESFFRAKMMGAKKRFRDAGGDHDNPFPAAKTLGWQPTCECWPRLQIELGDAESLIRPCLVLDPFAGSGTVGVVCLKLNRSFVGIELKPDYCEMANKRVFNSGSLLDTRN